MSKMDSKNVRQQHSNTFTNNKAENTILIHMYNVYADAVGICIIATAGARSVGQ